MKMFIRLVPLFVILLAHPVWAQDSGPYVSGHLGYSILSDGDASVGGLTFGETSFDPGPNFGFALGYQFNNYFRLEGELAYRTFDADQIQVLGASFPLSGESSALSFMANGYYDFQIDETWKPYVGIGIGGANVSTDVTSPAIFPINDSSTVFASQVMAGLGYELTPSTTLTGGYRLFATANPEFQNSLGATIETEVVAHEFNFGVRYMF